MKEKVCNNNNAANSTLLAVAPLPSVHLSSSHSLSSLLSPLGNSPSWFNVSEIQLTLDYVAQLLDYKKFKLKPADIGTELFFFHQISSFFSVFPLLS